MGTTTKVDNAATVASLYQAFSRGEISVILDHLADDCKWIGAGEGSLPPGGVYKGKEAANFFKKLGETEEFNAFNVQSVNNINENEVVAFGNMVATARTTGKKASADWVMHWKFNKQGKVVYFRDYFDTAAVYMSLQRFS